MMHILMMGAPGAGKGTQAKILQDKLGIPQISTGDLFRYNLKNETALGQLAKSYMDKGDLVPDDVTVDMVRDRFTNDDCEHGAILDGFPRSIAQAKELDTLLAERGAFVDIVFLVDVNQDELIRRLLIRAQETGRVDDTEEVIRNRMVVYDENTAPLIDFYEQRGRLIRIDGEQSIEAVNADLLAEIARFTVMQ